MGLEVERDTAGGHWLSFTTVLGLASLQARRLLSPRAAHSMASLRYSSCGGCPRPAVPRRWTVMTSVPASVRVQLTDSGSVSSGSWHLWVKVSQTVPSSATCGEAPAVQWNAVWDGGFHSTFPVTPVLLMEQLPDTLAPAGNSTEKIPVTPGQLPVIPLPVGSRPLPSLWGKFQLLQYQQGLFPLGHLQQRMQWNSSSQLFHSQ